MLGSDNDIHTNAINEESDEKSLVIAAKQNPKEFSGLYLKYVKRVFQYSYSRIGNLQEAEDITAQTFLAAFTTLDRFRNNAPFAAWLFSIARNKVMDHFRHQKVLIPVVEENQESEDQDLLENTIHSEQVNNLSNLIQKLNDDDRELLRLRFMADMSFPEIAHLLQRNEGTVKKAIYRLLDRLHNQVEDSNV